MDPSFSSAPLLHEAAPDFTARTTLGPRRMADYRGRWLLFFAHPADFTPVCASEFLAFSRAFPAFQAMGCDLLGLSVDSLSAHLAWIASLQARFGVQVPFPVIEDPTMVVARAYGMLHPGADGSATVRASFVIDPEGLIRAITWYPMNVGRSVAESLRLIAALQTADRRGVLLPEAWQPGDPALLPPSLDAGALAAAPGPDEDWYYRLEASHG
ncbi:MAG: peroxiredoxin [Rhodospirillales bacterium]|nr:peroxiredoxin [Rhodospirillales bacterium]